MRIVIDGDKCQGTGYCEMVNSELFRVGENGLAEALKPAGDPALDAAADDLREAETLCPMGAIAVVAD
ncbi:ferredoxin [Actinophytocola sp.]|uniref:ferredoxin n=1 Tax=Actinophytocola sp. TaxID=1872138 RepID=UPI003D6C503E